MYNEVKSKVLKMYPELIICEGSQGISKPLDYCTISWCEFSKESAHYVAGTYTPSGEEFYIITLAKFSNEKVKTLALLHEVGHHSSDQPDDTLTKEMNAWVRCRELYKMCGLDWDALCKEKVSEFFSSYVYAYGATSEVYSWMVDLEVGLHVDKPLDYTEADNTSSSSELFEHYTLKDYTQTCTPLWQTERGY